MIKLISTIIVILFCWVIYPYKWIKHAIFINRKSNAIKQADKRQKKESKKVLVVQIGNQFIVGVRDELKRIDKKAFKILRLNRNEQFIWDYRNSIIYEAK